VPKLVEVLALKQPVRERGSKVASEVESQAMLALYNLCKLSKVRQEQAASHGIVPCLQRIILSNRRLHPLRQLAIPLLCDLAHAGKNARHQLLVC